MMGIYGSLWEFMGNLWEFIAFLGNLWEFMMIFMGISSDKNPLANVYIAMENYHF